MICKPCRNAADQHAAGYPTSAEASHARCRGQSWCDCQHKIGPVVKESAR